MIFHDSTFVRNLDAPWKLLSGQGHSWRKCRKGSRKRWHRWFLGLVRRGNQDKDNNNNNNNNNNSNTGRARYGVNDGTCMDHWAWHTSLEYIQTETLKQKTDTLYYVFYVYHFLYLYSLYRLFAFNWTYLRNKENFLRIFMKQSFPQYTTNAWNIMKMYGCKARSPPRGPLSRYANMASWFGGKGGAPWWTSSRWVAEKREPTRGPFIIFYTAKT